MPTDYPPSEKVCSWEDFRQVFVRHGVITLPRKGVVGLRLKEPYRIRNIVIKNGRPEIELDDFGDHVSGVLPVAVLSFHNSLVTEYNLPHLARNLRGENFRVEPADPKLIPAVSILGGKYCIQVGSKNLKFHE